ALLIDPYSGNWRSFGQHRNDDRQRVRPSRIFDECTHKLPAAGRAAGAGHDQGAVIEFGHRLVLIGRAAIRFYVGDGEVDSVWSGFTVDKAAVDESQCSGIRAVSAVNAPYFIAADRELIGVRFTLFCPPAATIIVGSLWQNRLCRTERRQQYR